MLIRKVQGFRCIWEFQKGRPWGGLSVPPQRLILLDHFNDAMAARVDQHRPIVDDRVAVFASAVFPRHFVVRHAFFRKFGALTSP